MARIWAMASGAFTAEHIRGDVKAGDPEMKSFFERNDANGVAVRKLNGRLGLGRRNSHAIGRCGLPSYLLGDELEFERDRRKRPRVVRTPK